MPLTLLRLRHRRFSIPDRFGDLPPPRLPVATVLPAVLSSVSTVIAAVFAPVVTPIHAMGDDDRTADRCYAPPPASVC
ncbi:MAG: hypothetical protein ACXVFR_15475 [Nocardioidaceae bacterium]